MNETAEQKSEWPFPILEVLNEINLTGYYTDVYSGAYILCASICLIIGGLILSTSASRKSGHRKLIAHHWWFLSLFYLGALVSLQGRAGGGFIDPYWTPMIASFFSQLGIYLSSAFLLMGLWEMFHSIRFSKKAHQSVIFTGLAVAFLLQVRWINMEDGNQRFLEKVLMPMLLMGGCYLVAGLLFCPCLNKTLSRFREFKSSYFLNMPLLAFGLINFGWFTLYYVGSSVFEMHIVRNIGLVLFGIQTLILLCIGLGLLRVAMLIEQTQLNKVSRLVRQNQIHGELGQLSAGIVHDINNCVSVINMSAELAKSNLHKNSPAEVIEKKLDVIIDRAKTISQTSGEMLNSIRAQTISVNKRYPITPDESLSLLEPALQMIVPSNVHLEFDLRVPLGKKICCAINDFEMIILNLVKNSVDAISEKDGLANKGWIRIQSEWVSVSSSVVAGNTDDQREYIRISIADNGCGMSEDVLQQSTEVEFSTKGDAGSGFGLANVQSFIHDLKGRLSIKSEDGQGTKVELLIPVDLPYVVVATESSNAVAQTVNSASWNTVNISDRDFSGVSMSAQGGVVLVSDESEVSPRDLMGQLNGDSEINRWSILEVVSDSEVDRSRPWRDRGIPYAGIHVRHSALELHAAIRNLLNMEWQDEARSPEVQS